MRSGLDADDRDSREQIFGKNVIDIQQKPLFQLLIDEVSSRNYLAIERMILTNEGLSPILYLPTCEPYSLVSRRILLLCCLHFPYLCLQH
jgi:hypothetical protein